MKNICLGTAQFGYSYGITNKKKNLNVSESKKIIKRAIDNKIYYFDTAQSYGSSETLLGSIIKNNTNVRIISKLSSQQKTKWNKSIIDEWEQSLFRSIKLLNISHLDTFLVHNAYDLLREDSQLLINWLLSIKERKLVKKIGISIYQPNDLNEYLLGLIDVIQFPISIYDQRFVNENILKNFKKYNIELHARSIFLQGLILEESSYWPEKISNEFKNHHAKFERYLYTNSLTLLDAAISFIKNIEEIDLVLVGVTSIEELKAIVNSWKKNYIFNEDETFHKWAWDNPKDIDPRIW